MAQIVQYRAHNNDCRHPGSNQTTFNYFVAEMVGRRNFHIGAIVFGEVDNFLVG